MSGSKRWFLATLPNNSLPEFNKRWRRVSNVRLPFSELQRDPMFSRYVSLGEYLVNPGNSRYFWVREDRDAWALYEPGHSAYADDRLPGVAYCYDRDDNSGDGNWEGFGRSNPLEKHEL